MKNKVLICALLCFNWLLGQQDNVTPARDGFLSIATDARSAAQGDMGVATSPDAFSQF